jgi:putative ABC transport system ATP-binding protein
MSTTSAIPVTSTAWMVAGDGHCREPTIRLRGLQHSFGEKELARQVLFDNSLDVWPGEIVIMTGPSGSGKTTLLTLIGTLRRVQQGSLQVLGRELHGASSGQLVSARRELGFIFQAHNLFESLTAFQNVRMAMELFNISPREMQARTSEMLTRLGLSQRMHHKPGALSGGQKQRVAIARALVNKPKLILADEPTAALDEASGREVVTLFQQLVKEANCTLLMVTHDNRILDVADRIVNMIDGRIKSDVNIQEAAVTCEFLLKCPVFARLTPATLSVVADKISSETHPQGTVIIRQGDAGDKFYLIRRGAVDVVAKLGDESTQKATLGEGDFFGETALLTGAPRNASVIARDEVLLYVLGKEDFQAVVAASASFEQELRQALFSRQ